MIVTMFSVAKFTKIIALRTFFCEEFAMQLQKLNLTTISKAKNCLIAYVLSEKWTSKSKNKTLRAVE